MWETEINKRLQTIEDAKLERILKETTNAVHKELIWNGRRYLNLATNNYLGFSGDGRLIEAQRDGALYGAGATASRLVAGNHAQYELAERALLDWKQAPAGLILNSGYSANIGVLSALCGRNEIVFSDRFNHASITDGILLSRAIHKRYRHNDMEHLEALLQKASPHARKIIITDSVFSMDGDVANLKELVRLKRAYNTLLIVDEAHSSGVFGEMGRGLCDELGVMDDVDIQMGTFSKALGSLGAYIVGDDAIISLLRQTMRSFIFTTALPPAILASIEKAIHLVQTAEDRRIRLLENANCFRNALKDAGFHTFGSTTQIVPIRTGENAVTIKFAKVLQEKGIAGIPIRPPTVPVGEGRIRFAMTAMHSEAEVLEAAKVIIETGQELGVIV